MDGLFNLTRPPKPSAEGSNPSAPARKTALLRAVLFFYNQAEGFEAQGGTSRKIKQSGGLFDRRVVRRRVLKGEDFRSASRSDAKAAVSFCPCQKNSTVESGAVFFVIKQKDLGHERKK